MSGMLSEATAIAFTANAISGAREMFLREGFDEFLPKPIEDLELERVLRKVLTKAQIQYTDEGTAPEGILGQQEDAQQENVQAGEPDGGADGLSETAKNTEDASRRKDGDYFQSNHGRLLMEYGETAEKIREAAGFAANDDGEGEDGDDGGGKALTEITPEELLCKLQELKRSLGTFELDQAQGQIEELGATVCQGRPVEKMIRGLWQAAAQAAPQTMAQAYPC